MDYIVDKANKKEYLVDFKTHPAKCNLCSNYGSQNCWGVGRCERYSKDEEVILHEGHLGEVLLAILDLPLIEIELELIENVGTSVDINAILKKFNLSDLQITLLRHKEYLWWRYEGICKDVIYSPELPDMPPEKLQQITRRRLEVGEKEDFVTALKTKLIERTQDLPLVMKYINHALHDEELYQENLFLFMIEDRLKKIRVDNILLPRNPLEAQYSFFNLKDSLYYAHSTVFQEEHNDCLGFANSLKESFATLDKRDIANKISFDEAYYPLSMAHLALISFYKMIELDIRFKPCANCGKAFIPLRSDALYCHRISLQDKTKFCKEYGSSQAYQSTLKTNEARGLHRAIYMQKQMLAKRNSDIAEYRADFELYKLESKEWRKWLAANEKSDEEFMKWLNDRRKTK